MSQTETKQCSVHENRVGYVCLFKGCDTTFLCRTCYRGHPETHEAFLKEVYELHENPEWTQIYEKERDLLVEQGKEVYSLKEKILSKYTTSIEEMIDQIIKRLEKHKKRMLEELADLINQEEFGGKKNLFSDLEENMKILQEINFKDGDDFNKVALVKEFNEKFAPLTKIVIDSIETKMENCQLDQIKMNRCRDELIGLIENVHVKNFCPSNSFQSLKDNDALSALTKANEELAQSLEKLETQVEELRVKNDSLNNDKRRLEEENEDLLRQKNDIKEQFDALSRENIDNKAQNIELSQKIKDLINTMSKLEEENKVLNDQVVKKENAFEPKKELSLGWAWSSTQKSSKISLSEDLMKATKNLDSHCYTSVFGSIEMSHGRYKWEIEVLCTGTDKNNFVFGVIESSNIIGNLENMAYYRIIGLGLNERAFQAKIENKLPSYDEKVYLCHLDCDAGTFTISQAGIIICRQEGNLKNKTLVPVAVMKQVGSTAELRPVI